MRIRLTVLLTALALVVATGEAAKKTYSYYRVSNASDIGASTSSGTVLMGGGTDVDEAFQWMCERAGGGDFLVDPGDRDRRLQSLRSAACALV